MIVLRVLTGCVVMLCVLMLLSVGILFEWATKPIPRKNKRPKIAHRSAKVIPIAAHFRYIAQGDRCKG